MNRRQFCLLSTIPLVVAIAEGCSSSSTAPTTAAPALTPTPQLLTPLSEVVSANGTKGSLQFHGYSNGGNSLLTTLRNFGLSPELIRPGEFGAGTYRLSTPSEFGWLFAVQNTVFGSDASAVSLNHDQLWAAYRKLSKG